MDDDYTLNASVNVYSVATGGYRTIEVAEHAITVIDRHKLPWLVDEMLDPMEATVTEGGMVELEVMDYTAEPITILAGQMSGSTMVMATADDMMENMDNMPEELVLYGMTEDMVGEVTGEVKFYLWDAAVPALPIIAQLLLAVFLAIGGYRRYRRR